METEWGYFFDQPLPGPGLDVLDPFLLLHHHGPMTLGPGTEGMPFGPHPHRGFETATFIVRGGMMHQDSVTPPTLVKAGGVQWMTAGRGLIHNEFAPDELKKKGGELEIIQLWINLPRSLKLSEPGYQDLQPEDIPVVTTPDGKGRVQVVSGHFGEAKGAYESLTDIDSAMIALEKAGVVRWKVPSTKEVFLYVLTGLVEINGREVDERSFVTFEMSGEEFEIEALKTSLILFCAGTPIREPIVARGPFVMTSEQEIREAIADFQAGKMGSFF